MTLSKAMSEYLRHRAVYERSSPESIEQYDRTYRMFLAHLRAKGLPDVPRSFTSDAVREWGLLEGERGVGPRTIAGRFGQLASLAGYIVRLKDGRQRPLLVENPLQGLERPRYRKPESKFLHPEEAKAFFAEPAGPPLNLARDVLADTMLRVSEAVNASVGDVEGPDVEGNYEVRVHVKGGAEKRVPLSPAVASALRDSLLARGAIEERHRTLPLLANSRGQRWSRQGLSQALVRLGRKAGVKRFNVSAHKLRHTSATVALSSGADLKEVSSLLGHSKIETTAQYLHLIPGTLHEARAKQRAGLERYIRG